MNRFDYRAEFVVGPMDNPQHGEMTCSAADIVEAARYFQSKIYDGKIYLIEEME